MNYLYVFQICVLLVSVKAMVDIKSPGISDRRFNSGTKDGKRRNSGWQIVNGFKANVTDFPYTASVLTRLMDNVMTHVCGGTLIRPNHVLTSAYCAATEIDGKKKVFTKDRLQIRVGSDRPFIGGEAFPVDGVYVPEKFLKSVMEADIAVLAIGGGFKFNQTVLPVNLPKRRDGQFLNNLQAKGAECVVAGWGQLNYRGGLNDTLMAVKLNLIKTSYCRQLYENYGFKIRDKLQVCTYTEGKSPCERDIGSGLICGTGDSAYVWGTVSHIPDCGKENVPTVYTRVDAYYDFIEKALKGETLLEATENSAFTLHSTLSTNVITVGFVLSLNFECFLK